MTKWQRMDERARMIVRGTMEPLSGWYDSPDDLELEIVKAMHWAYFMGIEETLSDIERRNGSGIVNS